MVVGNRRTEMTRVMANTALLLGGLACMASAESSSTIDSARSRSPSDDQPSIRIVPQLHYEPQGLIDPTGRFAVARTMPHWMISGTRIIDLQRNRVAWNLQPLWQQEGFAFSSDGNLLARSTPNGGELIDLSRDEVQHAPWLKGTVPLFSPDDKLIYIASGKECHQVEHGHVSAILKFSKDGELHRSFPLNMNLVGRMTFADDGNSLVVEGGEGIRLRARAGGTFSPLRQTIDLRTGESTMIELSDGPLRSGHSEAQQAGFDALNFRRLDESGLMFNQKLAAVIWDSSTQSVVVTATGQPEGGVTKLWDFKSASLRSTLGKGNSLSKAQLIGPGKLIGIVSIHRENLPEQFAHLSSSGNSSYVRLVILQSLLDGRSNPLAILADSWTQLLPSPDGRLVAALIRNPRDGSEQLQVWSIVDIELVGEIQNAGHRIHRFLWTADGKFLIVMRTRGMGPAFWEFFNHRGDTDRIVNSDSHDCAFSPSGALVVVPERGRWGSGAAGPDTYRLLVRDTISGFGIAEFSGCDLPSMIAFLDEDRLLIAETGASATARLIDIVQRKTLWETRIADYISEMTRQPDSNAVVLRGHSARVGAEVLSAAEGRRLPEGDETGSAWSNPVLLHEDRLALDPLHQSSILQLRDTATGQAIVSLAAFADPEWIIYTPDGYWTGSENVLEWVAFYRGPDPLEPEEIAALRKPDLLRARISAAFR